MAPVGVKRPVDACVSTPKKLKLRIKIKKNTSNRKVFPDSFLEYAYFGKAVPLELMKTHNTKKMVSPFEQYAQQR